MAERGVRPHVPVAARRGLHAVRSLFTPLLPDDYLELINPLWNTTELRGRVVDVTHETPDAATILIKPGWKWQGHTPGQYLRIGVIVDGIHHWRAYSLTSDPGRPDGCISITPKLVDAGKVSPFLVQEAAPGEIVRLGGVEGTFVLPDPVPPRLLFVSAGSGVTPIMSMLRALDRRNALADVVVVHSARDADDVIFGAQLRDLAQRNPGLRLHEQHTTSMGRMGPADLDALCADWREREAFVSGPRDMLDALIDHFQADGGGLDRLHTERFQPEIADADAERGAGGTITFLKSDVEARSDGTQPILVAGEEAGATLPYGCRMGICHTCVGRLRSGRVRDLRTGEVHGQDDEMIRTCVHAPEGHVEIAL